MEMVERELPLFLEMLSIDSTSGKERFMAEWLAEHLQSEKNKIELLEVGDGTLNVRISWGEPKVWLCTHCDTVPPYIPPVKEGDIIRGRGSCDAKGQIFSMYLACRELERQGFSHYGLLVLSGEETGSHGAIAYDRDCEGGEAIIVGEPTENAMAVASKGTRSYSMRIDGVASHSGYPEFGENAIDKFVDFVCRLRRKRLPVDPILGATTWNIGNLESPNPKNIVSDVVHFMIYFRTTFASASKIDRILTKCMPTDSLKMDWGGDSPMEYTVLPGFPTVTVAFGSDTPRLTKFKKRILCGPGSIKVAHTENEFISLHDIETAISQYVDFVKILLE